MTDRFILYYAPGTCARITMIALEEIGAPFDGRLVAFMAGEHRSPDYLAVNPSGKVPCLVTDEGPLTQNSVILWYLAQRFPDAKLLPEPDSTLEAARLLSRLVAFAADLHPLVSRIVLPQMFCDLAEAAGPVRAKAKEIMHFQLGKYERVLASEPWLLGQSWSVLDAYLGWIWFRITGAGFETKAFPAIKDHYTRHCARPAVQRAVARDAKAQHELEDRGLAVPNLRNL